MIQEVVIGCDQNTYVMSVTNWILYPCLSQVLTKPRLPHTWNAMNRWNKTNFCYQWKTNLLLMWTEHHWILLKLGQVLRLITCQMVIHGMDVRILSFLSQILRFLLSLRKAIRIAAMNPIYNQILGFWCDLILVLSNFMIQAIRLSRNSHSWEVNTIIFTLFVFLFC